MTEIQKEVMFKIDTIKLCGQGAKDDYQRLCRERGISPHFFFPDYTEEHLKVCREVWDLWHTTNRFKVGDKVYVVPLTPTWIEYCIRATVTEVGTDAHGYRLRAFRGDLPGIYMFNIWDKDLHPRVGRIRKKTPAELLIKKT